MRVLPRQRTPAGLAAAALFSVLAFQVAAQEVYRITGGVSPPKLIHKVDPEYTDEARAAKLEGIVVLYTVIDEEGIPRDLKVLRPLGMGLDETALEAVRQWRCWPAMNGREPVRVAATVDIAFRLPKEPEEEK